MFARLQIRVRLVLLVSLILLPLAGLQGWTIYHRAQDQIEQRLRSNVELVEATRAAVSMFLNAQTALNQTIGETIAGTPGMTPQEIRQVLQSTRGSVPHSRNAGWVGPDGRVVASTVPSLEGTDVTNTDHVRRLLAGESQVVSDALEGRGTGQPVFAIATAVRRDGQLVGIITTFFDTASLARVLDVSWPGSGRVGLADRNGVILFVQGEAVSPAERRTLINNPGSPAAQALVTGRLEQSRRYIAVAGGEERMGAAVPIPGAGWVAVASARVDEVLAPAVESAMLEFGILLGVSGLALAGAWAVASGIAGQARALQRTALAFAGGDRSARVGISGPDELGAAAAMFDQMAGEMARTEAARNAEIAVREVERSRLRTVLSLLPAGVIMADATGRLVEANQAASTIWGGPAPMAESIPEYESYRVWWHGTDRRVTPEEWSLSRALRNGEACIAEEFDIECFDGRRATVLTSAVPLKDEAGAISGAVTVFVDVTHQKELEARLRRHSAMLDRQRRILEKIAGGSPLPRILAQVESLCNDQHPRCQCSVILPNEDETGRRGFPETDSTYGWSVPVYGPGGEPVCAVAVRCCDCVEPDPQELAVTMTAANLARIAVESHQRETGPARKLQALMSHMHEGVIALDSAQNLILINPAAVRLLRLTGPFKAVSLFESGLPSDLVAALDEAGSWGDSAQRVRVRIGQTELDAQVSAVHTELGRYGTLAVIREITGQEQFRRLQESFVANVSHELRGPLASMSATLEAMADGLIPETNRPKYMKALLQEMARLRRLSYDVVELTRLDSGLAKMELQEIDLGEIFQQTLINFEQRATAIGLTLVTESGGERAVGDYDRVRQVITNLLENALRFTPDGGTIRLNARRERDVVRISVSDTGIGIPAEHQPHIWNRFYKVDSARTFAPNSGTGLGLAIVRHLVEAMHGQVALESEVNRGSTFSFTLPAVR